MDPFPTLELVITVLLLLYGIYIAPGCGVVLITVITCHGGRQQGTETMNKQTRQPEAHGCRLWPTARQNDGHVLGRREGRARMSHAKTRPTFALTPGGERLLRPTARFNDQRLSVKREAYMAEQLPPNDPKGHAVGGPLDPNEEKSNFVFRPDSLWILQFEKVSFLLRTRN